jgi:LPPG:FO 2-phospho-L-lactate transferase
VTSLPSQGSPISPTEPPPTPDQAAQHVAVLCGGVGAARYLSGLQHIVDPSTIRAIVNVGDDTDLHGLRICPDLDTITYTLSNSINTETGWGLAGETWRVMEGLKRFASVTPAGSGAGVTWFGLGDSDIATHAYRTHRLGEGASLSTVTDEVARAFGLALHMMPVSDDRLATQLEVDGPNGREWIDFQTYFVRLHHSVPVYAIRFVGAPETTAAPGVLDAITTARRVVIAPSNPLVSIDPVLAVPGVRAAVERTRERCVAVSPIVGGGAIKGPADRMLVELGFESSVVGVARYYASLARWLIIDHVDASLADAVRAAGMEPIVTNSVMKSSAIAAALATTSLHPEHS